MPRNSSSQQQNGQHVLLVENMLRKQEEYREGIRENHSLAKSVAGRLQHGGQIEQLVGDMGEYRDRLKKLTENNIKQERQLDVFLRALQGVANQHEDVTDYQAQVDNLMNRALQQVERRAPALEKENMYTEICNKLGESLDARSGGDEELQVVETQSTLSLKCPLTQRFLSDPVKHVTCGHVFSREAILQHIKNDKRCPVVGCTNDNIQADDLQPDPDIERQVKRAQRQEQIHQKALSQQAIDADEEEEF